MDNLLILGDILTSDSIPEPVKEFDWSNLVSNIIVIVGGISAAYFGIKKWVKKVAKDTEYVKNEISTTNGNGTLGHQVEELHHRFDRVEDLAYSNRAVIEEHRRNHP